jgi:hypothetical protein
VAVSIVVWVMAAALLAAGPAFAQELVVRTDAPPSPNERYCAWFGAPAGDILYFGEAAFWTAFRAQGRDPRADLRASGPQRIGRLDLASEQLLPALDVTRPGAHSGIWDVLPHPNGRVYFTTFFEESGWVEPATGVHGWLDALGPGFSELALASEGQIAAARYGRPGKPHGSLVHFSPDGELISEWPMEGPAGVRVAPKSVAFDPLRRETWALTDLLPAEGDGTIGHDARIYDRFGQERLRIERPEIQFVAFAPDGTGYLAELEGAALWLRILAPGGADEPTERGERVLLDAGFPTGFDFLQDLQLSEDGRVVATRWSGWIHLIDPERRVSTVRLPRLDDEGLYYTGVLRGDRVCATYCAELTVVCRNAGEEPPAPAAD